MTASVGSRSPLSHCDTVFCLAPILAASSVWHRPAGQPAAMAVGVPGHVWTLAELLEQAGV